jgi:TonB family protein
MRTRDVTIPLSLWICAAIGAHFFFGTGGLVVAKVHDDRSELWKLARQAGNLTLQGEQTFEVSLGGDSTEPAAPPAPKPIAVLPPPAAEKPRAPEEKPQAPDKPKPAKPLVIVEKKAEEKQATPPDLLDDRRIAVRQHAKPNQEDNPKAAFIADQANHVASETAARLTSHDRDDENPTPGGNHPGSDTNPGDSDKTHIASSEDHIGDKNHAPGERGTDFDVLHEPQIPKASLQANPATTPRQPPSRVASAEEAARAAAPSGERAERAPGAGGEVAPATDEVESGSSGTWRFNPTSPGGADGTAFSPRTGSDGLNLPGGKMWSLPGLGQSPPAGAMNVNLATSQIAVVVGSDNLRRVREADGERRRTEHRGSWAASGLERWRSAIENYVANVRPGNQTALNTAAVPFASYLNAMHNRIHPFFADAFLQSLSSLPAGHPMNDMQLMTTLEIVLTREGHLRKMGVVKSSGITAFDIAALDAVDRAQPFGRAPGAIISPDGNVYLHWQFHRDEGLACSTFGARPFLLRGPPPNTEPPARPQPVPSPGPSKEQNVPTSPNDAREGELRRPRPFSRAQSPT